MTLSAKNAFFDTKRGMAFAVGAGALAPIQQVEAAPTFIKWTCLSAGIGIDQDTTACAEAGQADGIMYHDDYLGLDMYAKRFLEGPIGLAAQNSVTTANIDGITGWRTSTTYAGLDVNGNALTDMYQMFSAYNNFSGGDPLDYLTIATDSPQWASASGLMLDGSPLDPSSLQYTFNSTGQAYGWAFHSVEAQNNAPEPASIVLVGAALIGAALAQRRNKKPANDLAI